MGIQAHLGHPQATGEPSGEVWGP
ncbi:uncharacterized protein ARMOST_22703 [Armillaria ostoyae]|uniref:Uncharacterized protein n=1 Tax=Armillaria ostoyae TaxID=47428 RepID=A0A284SDL6_ARMOS|nr:uncharacterized protein ARMOST_22703 [Armillaria ostoyae]